MPSISLKDVEEKRALSPKRFRFSDNPAVREIVSRGHHTVGLKFPSLQKLFLDETGILTLNGPWGPYCFLTDPDKIASAFAWQEKYSALIFLRDNLDCSVALDFNLAEAGVYTQLGQAEHDAKTSRNEGAIQLLCNETVSATSKVTFYSNCDAVCSVPPSPDKNWDLPTEIAKCVAAKTRKLDLSPYINFTKRKESVKSLSLDNKWKALESAELKISGNLNGKKIILIDDKYQSGTTAQFVASRLYQAGAEAVYGLFCVKTWRDTDNT